MPCLIALAHFSLDGHAAGSEAQARLRRPCFLLGIFVCLFSPEGNNVSTHLKTENLGEGGGHFERS